MRRLLHVAMTRARRRLVLAYPERTERGAVQQPSPFAEEARAAVGGEWEAREEELFGPGRDAAVDVPAAARRAADHRLAGRRPARRAALRHRPRRLARGRPLPRAAQARRAARAHARRRACRSPRRCPRSTRGCCRRRPPSSARSSRRRALDEYLLDAERDEKLRARAVAAAHRAVAGAVPAPARRRAGAQRLRHRDLPDLPAEVQVRARLPDPAASRRSTSASGSSSTRCSSASTPAARRRARCPSCSGCSRPAGGAAASATPRRSASCARRPRSALIRYHERFQRRGRRAGLVRARLPVPARAAPAARARRPRRPAARRRLRADRLQDRPPEDAPRSCARTCSSRSTRSARARRGSSRPPSRPTTTCSTTRRCRSSADEADRDWITETVLEVADGHPGPGLRADAVATRRARCATTGSPAPPPSGSAADRSHNSAARRSSCACALGSTGLPFSR